MTFEADSINCADGICIIGGLDGTRTRDLRRDKAERDYRRLTTKQDKLRRTIGITPDLTGRRKTAKDGKRPRGGDCCGDHWEPPWYAPMLQNFADLERLLLVSETSEDELADGSL